MEIEYEYRLEVWSDVNRDYVNFAEDKKFYSKAEVSEAKRQYERDNTYHDVRIVRRPTGQWKVWDGE